MDGHAAAQPARGDGDEVIGGSPDGWDLPPEVPLLEDDRCQVWWARASDVLPWHHRLLSRVELRRLASYRMLADRRRFTAGCVITRLVAGALVGVVPKRLHLDRSCQVCGEPHGPPRITGMRDAPLLSVSHSGDRIAVAVSKRTPVGVDVECLVHARHLCHSAAVAFSQRERDVIDCLLACHRETGALQMWTRKEALVKALGDGLRVEPSRVSVSAPDEPARVVAFDGRSEILDAVTLADLRPGSDYRAAIALLEPHAASPRELDAARLIRPGQRVGRIRTAPPVPRGPR
jgi:4'-phosphopantetheinyl transferase